MVNFELFMHTPQFIMYIVNFQVFERFPISIRNPQIESPTYFLITNLDEDSVFT